MFRETVKKDLPVMVFSKGRVFGELCVRCRALPYALSKILEVLERRRIRVQNLIAYSGNDEDVSLILVDLTEALDSVSVVVDEVRALPDVVKVDFSGPQFDYACGVLGFPVTTSKTEEVMVVALRCLVEMFQGVKKCFGSSGEVFLWYLARELGSSTAKLLDERVEGLDAEERVKAHLALLSSAGWGIFELKRVDVARGLIEVRARDAFEIRHRKGSSETPQCLFMKGYLAGMVGAHLRVKGVRVEEVSCEARGDDACSFVCRLG